CDLGPFERAISVAERAGAVLLGLCRPHALGVALDAGTLDRGVDLLLVGFAQATSAVFDVVGKLVEGQSVGFQQARDGTQGGESLALTTRRQQANRLGKLDGELVRQCHGSSSCRWIEAARVRGPNFIAVLVNRFGRFVATGKDAERVLKRFLAFVAGMKIADEMCDNRLEAAV